MHYTNSGKLNVRQIAHVITRGESEGNLRKCLEAFFDDVSKRNITSISFSAIGAGLYGYRESAAFIFDSLSKVSELKISALSLIRVVIPNQIQFINFKDATKAYFFSEVASSSSQQSGKSVSPKLSFNVFRSKERARIEEAIINIYSDDVANIKNAWEALKRIVRQITSTCTKQNIVSVDNDTLIARDFENLGKLEKYFGFIFKKQNSPSNTEVKGNTVDFFNFQEICNILEAAEDDENKGKCIPYCIQNFTSFGLQNRKMSQYCIDRVKRTVEVT